MHLNKKKVDITHKTGLNHVMKKFIHFLSPQQGSEIETHNLLNSQHISSKTMEYTICND